MRQHLSDEALNGYIHHTLTDAQRESIDRHLRSCNPCRDRLAAAEQVQRRLRYGLQDRLRGQRLPAGMRFSQLQPNLRRERFWATFAFRTRQLLTASAGVAVMLLVLWLVQHNVGQPASVAAPEFQAEPPAPAAFAAALVPEARDLPPALNDAPIYEIELELKPEERQVVGQQRLYVNNNTADAWEFLYLRLPANVYGVNLTVGDLRVDGRPVTAIPESNSTLLRLPLDANLDPGERLVVDLAFTLALRDNRFTYNGTLGYIDDVLSLSYFHPILAPYDDGEWDLSQPVHGIGGDAAPAFYRVEVTAPADMVLISSGVQAGPTRRRDNRRTTTLLAGPIAHFYLTAARSLPPVLSRRVGGTVVNVYVVGDADANRGRGILTTTVQALTVFNELFGVYPYADLDVVLTPILSFPRPVVAYPGVVLIGSNHYVNSGAGLERAAVHGAAWQWFGLAAGPDTSREPWLTQSLSEQAVYDYMLATYKNEFEDWHAADLFAAWNMRSENVSTRYSIGQPVEAYQPGEYYHVIFGRGPLSLEALADQMGREEYTAFRRNYLQTFRWRAASGADFVTLAEAACDCGLDTLWWIEWVKPKH